ncbi:MAG: DUF1801 domain-containing protein [Actinobacteria bacterium]|nr:DUF1801 domain-containing protein [Actinomycetota bacterium]MCB9412500.1 DUF1801 domain-containing protein [Actinomycetota bacterium]
MQSDATTVDDYLEQLPPDRREQIEALLETIRPAMPEGLSEEMGFGMINWVVPLDREPDTYNGKPLMFAALASQRQHISLYLMTIYSGSTLDEETFRARWQGAKKLNMGRSCVRFKKVDDLDLDLILESISGVTVDEFVEVYRRERESRKKR